MKRASTWLLAMTVMAIGVSCGPSMNTTSTWKDPAEASTSYKKVLVMGLSHKETLRRTFESEFSAQLTKHGVDAVPSASVLPPGAENDREVMKKALIDGGYDGIIISRLVDRTKETTYVPGTSYVPAPYYGGFYSYYYSAYPAVYDPGYLVTSTIVQIETNLYDVKNDKLAWSAISEVVDPQGDPNDVKDFSIMVGDRMAKEGMIPKQMKP